MSNTTISADGFSIEVLSHGRQLDQLCDQVDVEVTFENGVRYSATLFTIAEVQKVMDVHRRSGECGGGKYFWCTDMLLVSRLDAQTIRVSVEELIQKREFQSVFSRLDD